MCCCVDTLKACKSFRPATWDNQSDFKRTRFIARRWRSLVYDQNMTKNYRQRTFILSFILMIVLNVSFGQAGEPCGKIYQMSDTLPELISSGQRIAEIVSSQIHIPDSLKN